MAVQTNVVQAKKSKPKMASTLSNTVVYKHVDAKDDNIRG